MNKKEDQTCVRIWKIGVLSLLLVLLFALTGCGKEAPEDYVKERLEKLQAGDEEMVEDDGSYFKKDNYLPGFREDGIMPIDNVNFFETKAPAMYEMFSKYGIIQAVQYIIGGTISNNDNNEIISYNRFKQDKKWAEMDMNFLAIIGDYVGNIYLREKEQ